ncbi:hypothetical protein AB5I41_03345 [Sphingomonas sp. MMS24-JH45]
MKRHIRDNVDLIYPDYVLARRRARRPLGLRARSARPVGGRQGQGEGGLGCGTSSCPTPRPEGLSNLDYAMLLPNSASRRSRRKASNRSAPDTGNMEVLERVGTEEQKERWLKPLLAGEIRSAYAMTEPRRVVGCEEHPHPRLSGWATNGSSTARNITSPAPATRAAR